MIMVNGLLPSTFQGANLQKTIYLAIQKWILFFLYTTDIQYHFDILHFQSQINTVSGCRVMTVFYGTLPLYLA